MNKLGKLFLGILTFWPIVYIVVFMLICFFSFVSAAPFSGQPGNFDFFAGFMVIIVMHFITVFLTIGLTIYYIIDVFRNDRIEQDKQLMWVLVIIMANMITMPI